MLTCKFNDCLCASAVTRFHEHVQILSAVFQSLNAENVEKKRDSNTRRESFSGEEGQRWENLSLYSFRIRGWKDLDPEYCEGER